MSIRLLAALAGLFHDFGKASRCFRRKLAAKSSRPTADPYRHEWVSVRMFAAFVGADDDTAWLARLAAGATAIDWRARIARDDRPGHRQAPLGNLAPLAQAVAWLILSHHRLPQHPSRAVGQLVGRELPRVETVVSASWCGSLSGATAAEKAACWDFPAPGHDPFDSAHWRRRAQRVARLALASPSVLRVSLDDPYLLTLARLSLVLADHHYSSLVHDGARGTTSFPLFANTRAPGVPKQRLDAHLTGVAMCASRIARLLPGIGAALPSLPAAMTSFMAPVTVPQFAWQDDSVRVALSVRPAAADHGFFGVNMASTGTGKTLANARILYGLARPGRGARFVAALGLRTLTFQTGDAYRRRLQLTKRQLAIVVGDLDAQEPGDGHEDQAADSLLESMALIAGDTPTAGPLNPWLSGARQDEAQRLLNAPVLCCTIDHLMPAAEAARPSRQLLPLLRLLTSDLILDEPDDFDLADFPALTRLVYVAGLLGTRVLLSSATLPPALVEGLFLAYREGRRQYAAAHGREFAPVPCAWFDEFSPVAEVIDDTDRFRLAHARFVARRVDALAHAVPRRLAVLVPSPTPTQSRSVLCASLAQTIADLVPRLHATHCTPDPVTGRTASFGLVRMANIGALVETARALHGLAAPPGHRFHLCVYHSQLPLLARSSVERLLDRALNRHDPVTTFAVPEVRAALDAFPEDHHTFIILATPVAEVGRDHDYDWAIIEPSSWRSVIQIAGRVRRHRPGRPTAPNIILLDHNLRALEYPGGPAFCHPGFETAESRLETYDLARLIASDQLVALDARARIQERANPTPRANLSDLEHDRVRALMAPSGPNDPHYCWRTRAMLTHELQRAQPFRHDPVPRRRFALLPQTDGIAFVRIDPRQIPVRVSHLLNSGGAIPRLDPGTRCGFWSTPDYDQLLAAAAAERSLSVADCALRFGYVVLPVYPNTRGWTYHPALGFATA